MVKLRRLTISGFRGTRYPLSLDLTSSYRSIAVFGENASGKSTIADAVEWFFRGKVDHLWREDCKEEALRNVLLGPDEEAVVQIEFSRPELSGAKTLSSALTTKESNQSEAFRMYVARSADERLVLRTAYLGEFINKRKGEKRKEVADIIGYEELVRFRDLLVSTANALERDADYINAKRNQGAAQAKLLQLCGTLLVKPVDLYAKATEIARRVAAEALILDEVSYSECLEQLKQQIARQEKAATRLRLNDLKNAAVVLGRTVKEAVLAQEQFLLPYRGLVQNRQKIRLLNVEQFLASGRTILVRGLVEANRCPFCGASTDLEHLRAEIERRLRDLDAVRREFQTTNGARDQWLHRLREVRRLAADLQRKWAGFSVRGELVAFVEQAVTTAAGLERFVEERFEQYQEIPVGPEIKHAAEQLIASLGVGVKNIEDRLKALELTREEAAILETIEGLRDLRSTFAEYTGRSRLKGRFEAQIRTAVRLRDRFIEIQNKALQDVLDVMSDDIRRYYLYLHPPKNENVDDVRMRIVGDEGIEFEYSFHGRKTYPPMKYLSESHLNSLGLALFFASVKLFSNENRFLVLDDVVTSFDAGHRLRLLRLLQEEFQDWQVVLLTHERHWFEMIKRELGPAGWLLKEVDWSADNGIQLRPAPRDLRALIDLKRLQHHDVANDVRTLLEAILKEVCYELGVKVAFRYNDRNEERMVGELLSELRGTLNRKASGVKDDPILAHLETSNLLGTKGSHDRPKEVSKGDIDVALDDVGKFEALFRCAECGSLASRANFIRAEDKVSCRCGGTKLDWKD